MSAGCILGTCANAVIVVDGKTAEVFNQDSTRVLWVLLVIQIFKYSFDMLLQNVSNTLNFFLDQVTK